MKLKYILPLLCVLPSVATAAIPYRVQSNGAIKSDDRRSEFADQHRFYVGAMYNFAMWDDAADGDVHVAGKNTSSFEGVLGMRIYDTFRIEANYLRTDAAWRGFSLTGDTVFVNAIFDARIDALYRMFYHQRLVPYVGAGAGASWNRADDVSIGHRVRPVAAALAGIGVELGDWFTMDFGYRYMYMFKPEFENVPDYAPTAHQFRAGVRVNF